jgi:hypothetical protein
MRKAAKSIDFMGFGATYVQHTFVTLRTRIKCCCHILSLGFVALDFSAASRARKKARGLCFLPPASLLILNMIQ